MSNKRKDAPDNEDLDDEERVQTLKAKRSKGKERVSFSDRNQTQVFNVDEELQEGEDQLIEGDRITKVLGEEDQEDWSDEEAPAIEPFNLRSENEEGYFDRNGNYVENKMDREVQDAWLDEYDEKWAKKFNAKQAQKPQVSSPEDDKAVPQDRAALLKVVLEMLNPKESVTAALKRFSGGGGAAGKKGGKGAKSAKGDTGKEGRDMDKFNKLTETADLLLSGGYSDIYSDKREDVEDTLNDEITNAASSSSTTSSGPQVMWEYKGADGTMFGPYTSANMRDWMAQGYFKGESAVQTRKVKDSKQEEEDMFADAPEPAGADSDGFVSSDTIDFSLYP
eukprot:Phypoly_transcript_12398.p1 GENE.Phypoly_transcript_12398~~Phypoly_transcript_12398.p1  ORF type:complete len:336 (+),score=92.12 Phypoly_transcript_12398:112-1119(+)